jgi:hypothetical protein
MAKIVENYGCLYRLTDANYRRLLTFVVAAKEYDLLELGAHIGCVHVSMVNFGKDDAEFELSRLQIEGRLAIPFRPRQQEIGRSAGQSGHPEGGS